MPHSRGFQGRQSQRRRTEWFAGPGQVAASSFAASTSIIHGGTVITSFGEETLVRTRGIFCAYLKTATAVGDGFFGAVGIGKATASATAAGVASVPTPLTEVGWDGWLYHRFFSVHSGLAADGSGHERFEVDSKAMRKLQEAEAFYIAIEVLEIGTATMDVFCDTRMLVKLP